MNFDQRFKQVVEEKNSLLCVGLDPSLDRMPRHLGSEPDALFDFCRRIIESTQHVAAAFKFNFAFFEAFGSPGWRTLEMLAESLPTNVISIADAKRADIGSTSKMYAQAIFQQLGFDAVTVNPYLGGDAIEPFLEWPEKGAFVLCVTSNSGSRDFQRFPNDMAPLYLEVVRQVRQWNQLQNCGLVVGATHPNELKTVRMAAPDLPFLVPGVGSQGGRVRDVIEKGTDASGGGALINASRSIIYASASTDFAEAARAKAESLRNEINRCRATNHNR